MEEQLKKIINHYGISKQLKYIHSEYFELDEAIMKFNDNNYNLICFCKYNAHSCSYSIINAFRRL